MSQAAAVRKPVVAIKVRPLPNVERGFYEFYHEDNKVVVNDDVYNGYDHVFGHKHMTKASDAEQRLHDSCVEPMLKRLFHGENCTILAYGQTGSGKTWTTKHLSQYLAASLFERASQDHLKLKVKFVEVYMDKFKDLIFPENARVDIFETGGSTYNFTAKEVTVECPEQLQEILDNAEHVRKTSKTHMNTESSRSHACLMITIEKPWNGGGFQESGHFGVGVDLKSRLPPTPVRTPSYSKQHVYGSPLQGSEGSEGSPRCVTQSTLFLVDLAGSERVGETGAVGEAAKEGASINNSLMNLRIIISDLRAGKRPPQGVYRRSKMTRLLQDSMGGNSNVLFIGCVTPSRFCDTDTKSTLQYAMKIAGITSTVAVNKKQIPSTMHAGEMIRALQMEVASLKSQLEELEKQLEASHQVHAADEDKIKRLETVILVQRTELEELQRKLQQELEARQQKASEAEALCKHMQTSISGLETEKQALEDQLSSSKAAVTALESEKQELQSKVQHAQCAEAVAVAAAQEAKQQVARLEEEAEEGAHREERVKQQLEKIQAELEDSRRGAEQQQKYAEQQAELVGLREEEAARQQQGLKEQLQVQQRAAEEQQQLHAANTAKLEEQLHLQQRAAEEQEQLHAAHTARLEEQLQVHQCEAEEQQQLHAVNTARLEEQLREQQRTAEEQQQQHAADCIRFEEQLREQKQVATAAQAAAAEVQQQLCAAQRQLEVSTLAAGDAASQLQAQLEASMAEQAAMANAHAAASASAAEELDAAKATAQQKEQQRTALEAQLKEQGTALTQLQAKHASNQEQHEQELANWEARLKDMQGVHAATQEQRERELADWAARLQAVQAEQAEAAQHAEERLQAVEGELQSVQAECAQLQEALQAASHDAGEASNTLRQQLDSSQEEVQDLKQQLDSALEELQGMKQQLGAKEQVLDATEQQLEGRAQELEANKMELIEVTQKMQTKEQELMASNEELGVVKQQVESRAQELEDSNEELGKIKQQLESRAQDLEVYKTECGTIRQQLESSSAEGLRLQQELESKQQEHAASAKEQRDQLESSAAEVVRLQQQLDSQQQEHAASAKEQRAQLESSAAEVVRLQQQLESQQQEHAASAKEQRAQLDSSAAEVVRLQHELESRQHERAASAKEQQAQLDSSAAEVVCLQQQLESQQQERAASAEEQQTQLEASFREVQEKAKEVEALKECLEASRQQHMAQQQHMADQQHMAHQQHVAEQQQQQMQLQEAHRDWAAVKQAALRVVQAAQEATSTMAARSAAVVRACHRSCAQKMSQELHALEQGWLDLQQITPTHESTLLHHLQRIQARHVALQHEAADLKQQVLAQEVEIGALKGVIAAASVSNLERSGQATMRSQEPAQEGHVQNGEMAGVGVKASLDDVWSWEAGADTIAQPDQEEGVQLHMLKADVGDQPEEGQECGEQQQQQLQQQSISDLGARDTTAPGTEESEEIDGQQAVSPAGDERSAEVKGGKESNGQQEVESASGEPGAMVKESEESNGQQMVELASGGPGAVVEEGEERNGQQGLKSTGNECVAEVKGGKESNVQQAMESASGGPEKAWDEVDVTCSLAFGMAEEDDLSMHVYDVHGEERDGTPDREPLSLEGSEIGSYGDDDDVSPELDQQPSPTRWKGSKGIPNQIDLSQVRLAIRSSIRFNDDYVLLDCEGNRRIVCKTQTQGGGEETSIMHGKYIPVGEPGQIPAEKMEGVLGNLQGEWLHLPPHGLQGLPETLLVRASVYSPSISRKRLQRGKGGTCDVAKACFATLKVVGRASASLELYRKPAEEEGRHGFEKLGMDERHRHQGSQLDVALVYPQPGCYSVTRLNVNHLDPESTVDLSVGDKRRVEVHPRALLQHALARLQESSPASESQQANPTPGHADGSGYAASTKAASDKNPVKDPSGFGSLKPHLLMKRRAPKKGADPWQRTKA